MPCIEIENLYKIYHPGANEVRALDGISLMVERGEFLAIVGHSGSGKSTLMNMMGCLDTPSSGRYKLEGRDVSSLSDRELSLIRNRHIGFVFQGFNLVPGLTALENVELPLIYRGIGRQERRHSRLRRADGAHPRRPDTGGQPARGGISAESGILTCPAVPMEPPGLFFAAFHQTPIQPDIMILLQEFPRQIPT